MELIHTAIVQSYLETRTNNKAINGAPPKINTREQIIPRYTRRALAQLRAHKCPLLMAFLHKISPDSHPTPMCLFCNAHTHYTNHIFTCQHIHTTLTPVCLWENLVGAVDFLARWSAVLGWSWIDHEGAARPRESSGGVDTTMKQAVCVFFYMEKA